VSVLHEHYAQSPLQDEHGDFFRNIFGEPHGVTTPHATNYEAVMLRPAQGSREVTLSSCKEAPPNVAIHYAKEGIKGGKKRCKQHPEETTIKTDHKDDNDGEVGDSSMRSILIAVHSDKRQARLPTHHFKRLLEETCPNHRYPIGHKLKDYDMMRSFMTSGSLTWGTELDEDPGGSDTTPFPRENALMTVYGGCPHWGGVACLT
jgi:hypothetical protein